MICNDWADETGGGNALTHPTQKKTKKKQQNNKNHLR